MQLKGKQIKDNSVEQSKLNITDDSIVSINDVTNVNVVENQSVDRISDISYSTSNNNMVANVATVGDIAVDTHVIEFPTSPIRVLVNGVNVVVGATGDCYFKSSDGLTIRDGSNGQKSDILYWNSTRFDLDTNDDITFDFITLIDGVDISANEPIELDPYYPSLNVKYTGADDTSTTVTIDGIDFIAGNVGGEFVWDIGGSNETTLTVAGDFVVQDVNGEDYTIWFDGFGSLLFSIKKGKFTVPIIYPSYGLGFNYDVYDIITDGDKQVVIGNFTTYNNVSVNRIVRLDKEGNIDNTFNIGTGFNNRALSMVLYNDKYIIVGRFTDYNGTTTNRIVCLNKDGSIDTTFVTGGGFNGIVNKIIIDNNNKLVAVGEFNNYNSTIRLHCVRINSDGSTDTTMGNISITTENYINTIIHDSNNKYVVGTSNIQGTSGNSNGYVVARYNNDGTTDNTFSIGSGNPDMENSDILSVIQDINGKYIFVGEFSTFNNYIGYTNIIRLNNDGSLDSTLPISTIGSKYSSVYNMIIDNNDKIIIVGKFYNISGYNRVVRLNMDGSVDTTFKSVTPNSTVYCVYHDSDNIYHIGGAFTTYDDKFAYKIAMLDDTGEYLSQTTTIQPLYNIRLTVIGTIGGFTNGVYVLEPTYVSYPDYEQREHWSYDANNLKLRLFDDYANFESSSSSSSNNYNYDRMIITGYNTTNAKTTEYYLNERKATSYQEFYISINSNLFKTYSLGNGVTMTLERVVI